MTWLRRLFRTKERKRQLSREIDKELAFHIDELAKENIAEGMNPAEAHRQAQITFGGQEQMAEETRRSRSISWLDDFRHDLRFGWRILLKSPGYTIGAILALSLGVGPNTSFFTLFDAVALKPLPIPLPDRIVSLSKTVPEFPFPNQVFSYPEYQYYRDHNTVFDTLSANMP